MTDMIARLAPGAVNAQSLAQGAYSVAASRWLTAAERSALPAGDDASGFVVHRQLDLGSTGEIAISVPASRRRALLIRQWAFNGYFVPGTALYSFGGFLEIENNADTTVFLDGVVIAEGFNVYLDKWYCSTTAM